MNAPTGGDLGRRFFEAQDRRRGGPDPALCAPDYQAVIGGNPPMDRDGHEQFALGFYAAFPDASHQVTHVVNGEGSVAVRFTIAGTHTGSFFGIPPTGKSISVSANILMETKDGRVRRLYGIFDEAGLLRQLGVLQG